MSSLPVGALADCLSAPGLVRKRTGLSTPGSRLGTEQNDPENIGLHILQESFRLYGLIHL